MLSCLEDGALSSNGLIRSGGLVWLWWSVLMFWFGGPVVAMVWSLIWLSCTVVLWTDFVVQFGGLPEKGDLVWRLKIEKIICWVYSCGMAQLNVRELRKQKPEKKGYTLFFFKISCNFDTPEALDWKRFAKTQPNLFRALVTFAATLLIPMSNILVTIQNL